MSSLSLHHAVELAPKEDVDHLDDRIDQLEVEMRSGFNEIHRALRHQMIATIGAITALTAIFGLIVGPAT